MTLLGDEIRRLVTETAIPFISEYISQWRLKKQFGDLSNMTKVQRQVLHL